MITISQTINFETQTVPPCIPMVQGDTGRNILFSLADYTIPTGATATYYVQKPSGEAVYYTATISDNTITCELTAQALAEQGENYMQVRILLDEEVVTSFAVILIVKPFYGIDAIESTSETNIFDQAVAEAETEIDAAVDEALADVPDLLSMLAPAWTTRLYEIGEYVQYNGVLYLRIGSAAFADEYPPSEMASLWRSLSVTEALEEITGSIADTFSNGSAYSVGDLRIYANTLYKCITAHTATDGFVSANWQAVTLADLVADLKTDLTALQITNTASGSIASFSDGSNGLPVESLEVGIEPVQDLNGYDNPWPAGGGKNLFQNTASTTTSNEITYTVNSDGTVTANGTASGSAIIRLGTITLSPGEYIISALPQAGSYSTWELMVTNSTYSSAVQDILSVAGWTVTITEEVTYGLQIIIRNGQSVTNMVFSPMIRLSSVSDATYAPYSNICPITGHTQAVVTRTGINIWDEQWEVGAYDPLTGQKTSDTFRIRCKNKIPVKPSTTYYMVGARVLMITYDVDENYLSYMNAGNYIGPNFSFTTDENTHYIVFQLTTTYGTTYNNDVSINYPSTDTDYHASSVQSVTIDLNGTYYGGTLEVETGVLTVTHGIVDLGTLTWKKYSASGSYVDFFYLSTLLDNCAANGGTNAAPTNIMTSQYTGTSRNNVYTGASTGICAESNGAVYIYDPNQVDSTAAEFKTAMDGVVLVYPLATTTTVTLTAEEVTTLLGQNNIFATTGNASVTYIADPKLYINSLLL